jgi:hypothetical protein
LQDLGMNASVVIAGKTADRFHGINKCSRGEVPVPIGAESIAALSEMHDVPVSEVRRIVTITFLAFSSLTVTVWNLVLLAGSLVSKSLPI